MILRLFPCLEGSASDARRGVHNLIHHESALCCPRVDSSALFMFGRECTIRYTANQHCAVHTLIHRLFSCLGGSDARVGVHHLIRPEAALRCLSFDSVLLPSLAKGCRKRTATTDVNIVLFILRFLAFPHAWEGVTEEQRHANEYTPPLCSSFFASSSFERI